MDVMHERVAGLDVHKETIVACVRIMVGRKAHRECRTFDTTTFGLVALLTWLTESGCTHVAMEATGVYWKPVWNILSDGRFELILANAAHIKNVPGRKTDMNDAMWIADLGDNLGTGAKLASDRAVSPSSAICSLGRMPRYEPAAAPNTSLQSRSAERAIAHILAIDHSDGAEERDASKEDQPSGPAQPPRRRW